MGVNTLKIKILFFSFVLCFSITVKAESTGEQLYMKNCMVCHAADGSGSMPGVIDLEENRAWSMLENKVLLERLKQGIRTPGARFSMPAKGGNPNLTDNDLNNIIDYMRQSFIE